MGKNQEVDGVSFVKPVFPESVTDLISNKTLIIAEVGPGKPKEKPKDPDTPGQPMTFMDCTGIGDVASQAKPATVSEEIIVLKNLSEETVKEESKTATTTYGVHDPNKVIEDFHESNVVLNTTVEGERVLLNQRLAYLTLSNLLDQLNNEKITNLIDGNRNGLIQSLDAEITRIESMIKNSGDNNKLSTTQD